MQAKVKHATRLMRRGKYYKTSSLWAALRQNLAQSNRIKNLIKLLNKTERNVGLFLSVCCGVKKVYLLFYMVAWFWVVCIVCRLRFLRLAFAFLSAFAAIVVANVFRRVVDHFVMNAYAVDFKGFAHRFVTEFCVKIFCGFSCV